MLHFQATEYDRFTASSPEAQARWAEVIEAYLADAVQEDLQWQSSIASPAECRDIRALAAHIAEHFSTVVIIGMGGAVLNPAVMLSLPTAGSLRIVLHSSLDAATYAAIARESVPEDTAFLVISKSGSTLETMVLTGLWARFMQDHGITAPGKHFFAILGQGTSPLRRFCTSIGALICDHQPVSGRFAGLTNVGLLPAALKGADIDAIADGAKESIAALRHAPHRHPALQGAHTLVWAMRAGKSTMVIMPYSSMLKEYEEWDAQMLAESLGKNGAGITPVKAIGPLDHHSQLQLYMDGPDDKFFSLLWVHEKTSALPLYTIDPAISFDHQTLSDVARAQYDAMVSTLKEAGRPVRTIEMDAWDEHHCGELMAVTMNEIILTGRFLGINPYDQPAVEKVKEQARMILGF